MIASRVGKLSSTSQVGVSWSDGVVRLRDDDLFGDRLGDLCITFLQRVFALEEVTCVEIDRAELRRTFIINPYFQGCLLFSRVWERRSAVRFPQAQRHSPTVR